MHLCVIWVETLKLEEAKLHTHAWQSSTLYWPQMPTCHICSFSRSKITVSPSLLTAKLLMFLATNEILKTRVKNSLSLNPEYTSRYTRQRVQFPHFAVLRALCKCWRRCFADPSVVCVELLHCPRVCLYCACISIHQLWWTMWVFLSQWSIISFLGFQKKNGLV